MSPSPAGLIRRALRRSVRLALDAAAPAAESGTHLDPAELPPIDPSTLSPKQAALLASPEMATFRDCLRQGTGSIRSSVLAELARYHEISEDEALKRCLHWETISLQEWREVEDRTGNSTENSTENGADRSDDRPDDAVRIAFYRSMQSWSYDLLWWAYLQAEGHADPASVIALRWLQQRAPGRSSLDFGAGIGVTAQLFARSGWNATLADLSSTLLAFARFRLERRNVLAAYIDLGKQTLPAGAYDAITAIDTLAHVPDMYETGRQLYESLRVGGYLIANIDVREPVDITVWHVQDDELRARYDLLRAGFRLVDHLGYGLVAYQRTDLTGFAEFRRVSRAWLTYVSPFRAAGRALTRPLWRAIAKRRRAATGTA
jgi:SAM-dependent methyltransferase